MSSVACGSSILLGIHCLLQHSANSVLDCAFLLVFGCEGGCICLDMSEHTCGVAVDASVPEVALDMSWYCAVRQVVVFPVVAQMQISWSSGFPSCRTFGGRCPCCAAAARFTGR